jgi:dUTP pyrophosphatase
MNRSSMAAKKNLVVGAHCIDSGYDGEVFIDIHNIGREVQIIRPYDKIAQLVLVPVVSFRAQEVGDDVLYQEPITISARGDGALGSTDR